MAEPRGPDCSAMLKRGLELIAHAASLDSQGNPREAFKQYGLGLECLISVLKWEKNERIRSTVKGKVSEYMNRAEQLKQLLELNDNHALALPTPPAAMPTAPTTVSPVALAVASTSHISSVGAASVPPPSAGAAPIPTAVAQAQVLRIRHGQTGCSYAALFSRYLEGAAEVEIEGDTFCEIWNCIADAPVDPYIRYPHQFYNMVRFCETLVKMKSIRKISLLTSHEDEHQLSEIQSALRELATSLREASVEFIVAINNNLHDRVIRCSNGWRIALGRGLDIYQKPAGRYVLGACDLDLRPCLETEISIYRDTVSS